MIPIKEHFAFENIYLYYERITDEQRTKYNSKNSSFKIKIFVLKIMLQKFSTLLTELVIGVLGLAKAQSTS